MQRYDIEGAFSGAIEDVTNSASISISTSCIALPEGYFSDVQVARRFSGAELLKARYPVLARLVGDEYFRFLANEFARGAPGAAPFRDPAGTAFLRFLRVTERLHGLACLSEIAALELMLVRAYHAGACKPATVADFNTVPDERAGDLLFCWHASVDLFMSSWPALSFWCANTFSEHGSEAGECTREESALIYRRGASVCILPIPRGTDLLLALLMRGHDLAEAAEGSLFADPEFDLRASLALVIGSGAVTGWDLHNNRACRLVH